MLRGQTPPHADPVGVRVALGVRVGVGVFVGVLVGVLVRVAVGVRVGVGCVVKLRLRFLSYCVGRLNCVMNSQAVRAMSMSGLR